MSPSPTSQTRSGRHKTKPIADIFNTLSGGNNNEYAPFTVLDDSPDELNFMFGFQLQFEFEGAQGIANVYFGKGSDATSNNWVY